MDKTMLIVLAAGIGNFLLRYIPMLHTSCRKTGLTCEDSPNSASARFLAAIGPAAITALMITSLMPDFTGDNSRKVSAIIGIIAVLLMKYKTRSFPIATLIGAIIYGVMRAIIGV